MAWSDIETKLPLDEYARIMAIPGWLFNQVAHDARPVRGECDDVWLQSGYFGDPNRIVGRDELAQAIALAESQIMRALGFWFTATWFCRDEVEWAKPRRGMAPATPVFKLSSGYFIEGGQEAFVPIALNVPVEYVDRDGDGVSEWATITVPDVADAAGICEVVVIPHGMVPINRWEIRPLHTAVDGANLVIVGWKWLFVEPEHLLNGDAIMLSEDAHFIQGGVYDNGVDVYRRYNNPAQQAQIVWSTSDVCGVGVPCVETCQSACIIPYDHRNGLVRLSPADYSAGSWTLTHRRSYTPPRSARFWYRAGYDDDTCLDCMQIGPALKEAIVRLANVHLPEAPCGCTATTERWNRDREEMDINAIDAQMAATHFGSTARGAIFAYNVVSRIPPLGRGG